MLKYILEKQGYTFIVLLVPQPMCPTLQQRFHFSVSWWPSYAISVQGHLACLRGQAAKFVIVMQSKGRGNISLFLLTKAWFSHYGGAGGAGEGLSSAESFSHIGHTGRAFPLYGSFGGVSGLTAFQSSCHTLHSCRAAPLCGRACVFSALNSTWSFSHSPHTCTVFSPSGQAGGQDVANRCWGSFYFLCFSSVPSVGGFLGDCPSVPDPCRVFGTEQMTFEWWEGLSVAMTSGVYFYLLLLVQDSADHCLLTCWLTLYMSLLL